MNRPPKCLFGINLGLGLALVHFLETFTPECYMFPFSEGKILPDSHRLQKQTTLTLKRLCELILNYLLHVMTTRNLLSFHNSSGFSNDGHLILECHSSLYYTVYEPQDPMCINDCLDVQGNSSRNTIY